MTSSKIIDTLAETIDQRREVYGHPHINFSDIAALWNVAFVGKLSGEFDSKDVAQAMRLVKEARLMKTPDHMDSLTDIAGYAVAQEAIVDFETPSLDDGCQQDRIVEIRLVDDKKVPKKKRGKRKVKKLVKAKKARTVIKKAGKKRKYTKRAAYWKNAA